MSAIETAQTVPLPERAVNHVAIDKYAIGREDARIMHHGIERAIGIAAEDGIMLEIRGVNTPLRIIGQPVGNPFPQVTDTGGKLRVILGKSDSRLVGMLYSRLLVN